MSAGDDLERKLLVLCRNNKLRSLIWDDYTAEFLTTTDFWRSLKYMRVLILPGLGIEELPEDVGELRHLRYLDISSNYMMERLPDSLCRLHNLQVLKLYRCPIQSLPQGMSKLVNLRHIDLVYTALISKIYRIGMLTSLQKLRRFEVQKHRGHKLEELSGLTELCGELQITNLENIGSKEEAKAGKLNNKVFIDKLTLKWNPNQDGSSESDQSLILEELFKDLQLHPTLNEMEISGYSWTAWDKTDSWPKDIKFPSVLRRLCISDCPKLKWLPPFPPSLVDLALRRSGLIELPNIWEDGSGNRKVAALSSLHINCPNLEGLEVGLLSQDLPGLETIVLQDCEKLMYLPMVDSKVFAFASLEELVILNCPKLRTMTCENEEINLPQSVKKLILSNCGEFDNLLPSCLHNLTSLAHLEIAECHHVDSLPLLHLKQLEYGKICGCDKLRSMEGLGVLKSLQVLIICKCPNLLINGRDEHGEEKEGGLLSLRKLCIDNTALLKISPLRNALPSINRLQIQSSIEKVMFEGEGEELFRRLTVLRILMFCSCTRLQSLPKELSILPSLELLLISNCREIESLPERLPTSLTDIRCEDVYPMVKQQISEKVEELKRSGRYRSVDESPAVVP